jgi:hypothetical protein
MRVLKDESFGSSEMQTFWIPRVSELPKCELSEIPHFGTSEMQTFRILKVSELPKCKISEIPRFGSSERLLFILLLVFIFLNYLLHNAQG